MRMDQEPQPIYHPLAAAEAPRVEILAESLARLARGQQGLDGWRDGWTPGPELDDFGWPSENWMTLTSGCALFAGDSWAPAWWRRYWRDAKTTRGLMGKEPDSRIYVLWGVCPSIMAAIKLGDEVGLEWSRAALAWLALQAGWGRGRNHAIDTKLWEGRSWTGTGARSYSTQHGGPIFLDYHPVDCLLGRLAGVPTPTWNGWGGAGPAWADWLSARNFGLAEEDRATLGAVLSRRASPVESAFAMLDGWRISRSWKITTRRYSDGVMTWIERGPAVGQQGTDKLAARWWRASDMQTGSEPAFADGVRIGDPEIRAIHSPEGEPIGWETPDGRRFDWRGRGPRLGAVEWTLQATIRDGFRLFSGDAPPQQPPAPPTIPPHQALELTPEMRTHLRAIGVLVAGHEPRPGWDADGAPQVLAHAEALAREVGRQRDWKR